LSPIEAALMSSGYGVVPVSQWEEAIDKICEEIFLAVILDSIFQCGNRGDHYDPARQIIAAARENGILNIFVSTVSPTFEPGNFPKDIHIVPHTCANIKDTPRTVMQKLKDTRPQ